MVAGPPEHALRLDWGTQTQARPQAQPGSKGRSPLKLFNFGGGAKPHPTTAYFIGYYGFGNAGDEHLLRRAKALVPTVQAWVLPHRRIWALWDMATKVWRVDVVVFGGGSLFQDRSSRVSLIYYLLILTWACLWRRRILLLGHGLGPIQTPVLRWWLSCLLPHVAQVVARDSQSYADFLSLGSRHATTSLGVDLAYTAGQQSDLWRESGDVVMSVNGEIPAWMGPCLESMSLSCFWVCMHVGHDETRLPASQMTAALSFPEETQGFSACIAMRYHACVWASLRGIPFLAVGDDPKLQALAKTFGQPVLAISVSKDAFCAELQAFWSQRQRYRHALLAALPEVLRVASDYATVDSR